MLDSVVEFISEAASSTAFIFCFCNLIIVIILVDLKPCLNFDQESGGHEVSHNANEEEVATTTKPRLAKWGRLHGSASSADAKVHCHRVCEEVVATTTKPCLTKWSQLHGSDDANLSVRRVGEEAAAVKIGGEGNDDSCCNEEEEERENDELRRRVEEFIEKVNEGWKAECFEGGILAQR